MTFGRRSERIEGPTRSRSLQRFHPRHAYFKFTDPSEK
jgi:hypothetical protein